MNLRLPIALALLLATFTLQPAQAAPPARTASDKLSVIAWLDAANGRMDDIIVEVEVNGVKDWGRPNAEGQVEFQLPADQVALIHFRKPGHITKSVQVDTHHMQDGAYKGKRRSIDFGVRMETESTLPGQVFDGPVGIFAFADGAGDLSVQVDRHVVPATRKQTIVF
ncbi:MAG: hypothetical protein KDB93_07400 [Flavobacteriales bacterium]|nr:hypothetical protein [Flavobacteriales bacterium]